MDPWIKGILLVNLILPATLLNTEFVWIHSNPDYPKQDLRLQGHALGVKWTGVKLVTQCAVHCERTLGCLSFNFHALDEICTLNSIGSSLEEFAVVDPGWQLVSLDTYTIDSVSRIPPHSSHLLPIYCLCIAMILIGFLSIIRDTILLEIMYL